jgi:type VI secretion system protein ImpH
MGSASRRGTGPVARELLERPAAFEFFQALRLLHKLRPGREPVGRDREPEDEVVRLRSNISFVFPPGDIRSIEAEEDAPAEVTVNFMGVASPGSFGSLPVPYIEQLHRQERDKNRALRDFLDLFNHRLISLFYRAWERARIAVLHDLGHRSSFEVALRALVGMEGESLRERLPLPDVALLSRVGLLARSPAPASVVESLVESVFGVRAEVEQFVPGWYDIDQADRSRLGLRNAVLGGDAVLGSRVRLAQPRFRIRLGPMDWERYESLLPTAEGFRALASLVRLVTGAELDFDFQPVLRAEDVPALRLESAPERPCRLGWSTWLGSEERGQDADQALFAASPFESPATAAR